MTSDTWRAPRRGRPAWVNELVDPGIGYGEMLVSRVVSSVESLEYIRDDSGKLAHKSKRWSKVWRSWYYTLGLPAALLAAVAGVSAVQNNTTLAAWFAFGSALIGGAVAFLRPEDRQRAYEIKTGRAEDISNRARLFLRAGMPNSLFDEDRLQEDALLGVNKAVASLTEELAAVKQGEDPAVVRERNARTADLAAEGFKEMPDMATYMEASSGARE